MQNAEIILGAFRQLPPFIVCIRQVFLNWLRNFLLLNHLFYIHPTFHISGHLFRASFNELSQVFAFQHILSQ